jgi:hypothetical protein
MHITNHSNLKMIVVEREYRRIDVHARTILASTPFPPPDHTPNSELNTSFTLFRQSDLDDLPATKQSDIADDSVADTVALRAVEPGHNC